MGDVAGIIRPKIEYKFWASPGQGQTLEELALKMTDIGNEVLLYDVDNNRLLLKQYTVEQDVWGCIFCRDNGTGIVIMDTEEELLAHCDADHEGWRNQ